MKTEIPQTENVPAVVQPPLVQLFEMLGRTIYAKVTGHVGCGEADEWCEEVMEEAAKIGLCERVPYNPDLHGEMDCEPEMASIWWWGFLPEGWQTTKPPIEFLNVMGEPETDPGKCGFLVINDARIEDLEAEVKKLKSERENWRMSSVCRQHEERIKELVSIGEFQDRTAQISLEYIGQLQEQNERLRDILVHLQHYTSCTSTQFEIIEEALSAPPVGERMVRRSVLEKIAKAFWWFAVVIISASFHLPE